MTYITKHCDNSVINYPSYNIVVYDIFLIFEQPEKNILWPHYDTQTWFAILLFQEVVHQRTLSNQILT